MGDVTGASDPVVTTRTGAGGGLRVLHAIDSLGPGGAERSFVAMTEHFVAAGMEVTIACLQDTPGIHDAAEASGARVVRLRGRSRIESVRELVQVIRSSRPDLVHTCLFEADVAGRLAGRLTRTPVVSSLVNTPYGPEHLHAVGLRSSRVRAAHAVDAATARLAVRFHAVSEAVADAMARRLAVPRTRIDVIHRGRDETRLGRSTPSRRARARAGLGVDADAFLVSVLARQDEAKGLDVLVDAVAHLRAGGWAPQVVVAGRPGTATRRLEAQIARLDLGGHVRLLGARDDVYDILAGSDLTALPTRREGFPGALVEALALEVPVVASDIGPTREVVGPDGGWLVPSDDAPALARAIRAAALDPARRADLARRGRQRFLDHFTATAVSARMIDFYRRSARPRPVAAGR